MTDQQSRILIIKLSAFGDFIQATGIMRAIAQHHPEAKITLLTTKPFVSMAQKMGIFDEVIIDSRPKLWQVTKIMQLKSDLQGFQRIYDLQNNHRTALYFRLTGNILGQHRPEWVGNVRAASHYDVTLDRKQGHAFDRHTRLLRLVGIDQTDVDPLDWMQGKNADDFKITAPYALIAAGAAPQHPLKRWPASSYAALCQKLLDQNITPVLLGTKVEAEVTQNIAALCEGVLNLTDQTSIDDLATLARGAIYAIGNDTGPMHIIAATGCPSLVLFSNQSNPDRHLAKGESVHFLQADQFQNISVADVWEKIPLS
jgi:ADP-heptose:LPS heptosyltransferase